MKNYVRKETDENANSRYFNENGQIHRTDGPACEFADGSKQWCIHGKFHRIDGPAHMWPNHDNRLIHLSEWRVNDKRINITQYRKLKELRKIFNDDDLLNELLLSEKIVL